ncbi:DUF4328 domain-containing protein [Mycobacterium sp. C3-094]|uniref:DUF4328 domain-containing protein n=1 Tax=Mycobacterium sp. PSTR-4-N TaxID=2917745 RepID=UPI001F14F842|nr:DUF4328 domain-containing protein [Mycobacterium sp. PSTR-4-N]MCG7596857.1 DUF4328 domain-containing protein [Mycobacterium sp. PSTR-4-N]
MIQVCSQCGTRWNVRDRQRVWCPRCRGTLLAPGSSAPAPEWGRRDPAPAQRRPTPGLPPGFKWIAVRPGAPPAPRPPRRDLGPTPRYSVIPRWGLVEHFDTPAEEKPVRTGPSLTAVQMTLVTTAAVLGAAAFVHLIRYVLLIVNRTVLLNPWVAGIATWGGVAVSVVALFTTVASILLLTQWLVSRRAAAYAHHGQDDPRPAWMLRLCCLLPLVNLFWAPVFVLELAQVEGRQNWLRRPISVWWVVWVVSTAVSVFSIATSFTTDPQGIADNTVTTIVAYLFAAGALLLVLQVFLGFERQPVERPSKRWLMVTAPAVAETPGDDQARAVEPEGQNPAA